MRLFISKYIPEKLYGFASDSEGHQVFFHLGSFFPGEHWNVLSKCKDCSKKTCNLIIGPPPPILGEEVEVIAENATQIDKAPKASQVIRIQTPNPLVGIVELFDFHRGYGFAKGTDGQNYHLHKSEFLENKIPRIGQELVFFGGLRMGKPRACHVKICPVE